MGVTSLELVRFWSKVNKQPGEDACWLWTGAILKDTGYGEFRFRGTTHYAHRVSWFLEHGSWPIPCALHSCDTRNCIRLGHLFEGTDIDNARDKESKGHGNHFKKVSDADVLEIRSIGRNELQREIASRFGISQPTVSEILNFKKRINL